MAFENNTVICPTDVLLQEPRLITYIGKRIQEHLGIREYYCYLSYRCLVTRAPTRNLHASAFHMMKFVNISWQQTMGSGCCETVNGFESVWVHACVSGVVTRRQFCVLARKAHSETPTCISRYICPFANALLGKLSRIDLHALAYPRNVHRNR